MNSHSLALEGRDEEMRMFTIKKDVDRHDSIVSTQTLNTAEKLLVVIRRLWRTSAGE
jgi:hypothetical protein